MSNVRSYRVEVQPKRCLCTPIDQAAAIDAAVEEVFGRRATHASGIPSWRTNNCPLHNPDGKTPILRRSTLP